MNEEMVHTLSRRELYHLGLAMRHDGRLHDFSDPALDEVFTGSIARFVEIAFRLRACPRVLDIGSGHGMLVSFLSELGHECHAVDFVDQTVRYPAAYKKKQIRFQVSNAEVDPLPFPDESFDAVTCCQVLEHFTHSHLPLAVEMRRVLRPGGTIEIDVPNAASYRNRSRMLRGKHITNEYRSHFLYAEPVLYKGMSFFPVRHNREFTADELRILLTEAGFRDVEVAFLKARRHREGLKRALSIGSMLRDAVPSLRKFLIAFAKK
jgi:ubiquinone/menaquinone biosynthesis C-methylase UbiE